MAFIQFGCQIINKTPDFLVGAPNVTMDFPARVRYFERLLKEHNRHPYLLVRLALALDGQGARGSALALLEEALAEISALDVVDSILEATIQNWSDRLDEEAQEQAQLTFSGSLQFLQRWKPTQQHLFPSTLHALPDDHQVIKETWASLFPQGSALFRRYLDDLAIETNHIEGTFLLTAAATKDLIRRGIAQGVVETLPTSERHDKNIIKKILNDTLGAYDIVSSLPDTSQLTVETIYEVHARLMENARFGMSYTPPGEPRNITRKSVIIDTKNGCIECCPYVAVERELSHICDEASKQFKRGRNPFALASWLHLVLARCHPFDDGNGRTTRLVASLPMIVNGYPPISIPLSARETYNDGINEAYQGNHGPMIECIIDGMRTTLEKVQTLE